MNLSYISSFVFFSQHYDVPFFLCEYYVCDVRWNELVPLYVIHALIHTTTTTKNENKNLTQKLSRLNCTRYHFHLHPENFSHVRVYLYGRSEYVMDVIFAVLVRKSHLITLYGSMQWQFCFCMVGFDFGASFDERCWWLGWHIKKWGVWVSQIWCSFWD